MQGKVFETILKNKRGNYVDFHMPGHKGGRKIPGHFKRNLLKIDTTELSYSDNLRVPSGMIREMLEEISKRYGSIESYLLVNGATQGIHAAFHATLSEGEKAIIAGDCHLSVLNALEICHGKPVFVKSRGIEDPAPLSAIEEACRENTDARILFFTYPNYYGFCADAKEIIELAHKNGLIVIVDEAHGAHFEFNKALPVPSLRKGADVVIHSMHKTLPVITQTGLLHVNNNAILGSVKRSVDLFSTTSPSYIFIVSAEFGFGYMQKRGKIELEKLLENIDNIKEFEKIKRIRNDDGTRIVFDVSETGATGHEISRMFGKRYRIFCEMADAKHIVLITSVMNTKRDFRRLEKALDYVNRRKWQKMHIDEENDYSKLGEKAGRNVIIYPPGTPVILEGEVYTKEVIDKIASTKSQGGDILEC
jgi:arginine decarboxylase